jgi:hypothetical protein
VVAIVLILIACLRIAATWEPLALTVDEPGHFACGLEYLSRHVYRYEPQHPPLARAMTAILPYLTGTRTVGNPDRENEGTSIIIHDAHPDRFVALMRAGMLPFFILACLMVFCWARHAHGPAVAALATGVFTLTPTVLAHAGVATTDIGFTACLAAAFYACILWAEQPTPKRAAVFGIATALAALSKFTALVYFPASVILGLCAWYLAQRPSAARIAQVVKERAASFALAVAVGAFVIWAGYFFHFDKVPAPEFFAGIGDVAKHNEEGHLAYLLGNVSRYGFWYYFPVVLAVKTPIAILILLGIGLWLTWKHRTELAWTLPLAFALGSLIPGMMGSINIGLRHILPVYVGFAITAAAALAHLARLESSRRWLGMLAFALPAWLAVSGALSHPDYLAYFNEIAASDPERFIVDSDLEWGQSTKLLVRRLKELGADHVNFGVPNGRSDYMRVWPGLPPIVPIRPGFQAEGYTAVNPTVDRETQYGFYFRSPDLVPWFDRLQPAERVGNLRLYYVPPGSLRRQ